MTENDKLPFEGMFFEIGGETIRLWINQYKVSAAQAAEGAMDYFQWLQGWPETVERGEIDKTSKALQKAEILKSILESLGLEAKDLT